MLKSSVALVLAALGFPMAALAARGGAASAVPKFGGIAVGTNGTGIYAGYTLVAGDNFDGLLSILHMDDPYARYVPTHQYGAGSRSFSGLIVNTFDSDPYSTGTQDCDRVVHL